MLPGARNHCAAETWALFGHLSVSVVSGAWAGMLLVGWLVCFSGSGKPPICSGLPNYAVPMFGFCQVPGNVVSPWGRDSLNSPFERGREGMQRKVFGTSNEYSCSQLACCLLICWSTSVTPKWATRQLHFYFCFFLNSFFITQPACTFWSYLYLSLSQALFDYIIFFPVAILLLFFEFAPACPTVPAPETTSNKREYSSCWFPRFYAMELLLHLSQICHLCLTWPLPFRIQQTYQLLFPGSKKKNIFSA